MGGGVAEELGAREWLRFRERGVFEEGVDVREVPVFEFDVRTWTLGRSWMMGVLPAGVNFLKKLIWWGSRRKEMESFASWGGLIVQGEDGREWCGS